jgi:uncharacterized damage-inducible protein DinB
MTLQEVKLLHAFNSWASQRVFDTVATLTPDQFTRDMASSHQSIQGTLFHIVAAEKIWLSRWRNQPDPPKLQRSDLPTAAALHAEWEKVGLETAKWLGTMTDKSLQDSFTMTTSSGTTYRHTYVQAVQHVVDHGSYHRGQIIALLRQLGVTPPVTGMIAFYREMAKVK